MKGRLNLFQSAMLRWREMHPYSAVHIVRVPQPLDAERLERGINGQLEQLGLTGLRVDARRRRYEWTGGAATTRVRVIAGGGDPLAVVCREIESELNIAFAVDGQIDPFRFFAVDHGAACYICLAYDHFVAGGDSIVVLLRGIVDRYLDASGRAPTTHVTARRYGPTYMRLFWGHLVSSTKAWLGLPKLALDCRRAFRPRYAAHQDGYNAFAYARIDEADRARLDACASAWGMTSHDLLLAILLKGLSPLTLPRLQSSRRNEIAIASILNIRRDLGTAASDALAPYLAPFRVSHRTPDDMPLRDLAVAIHAQTRQIRRATRYLQTLLAMGIAGAVWRFLTTTQRYRVYAKHYPVCAGTTPLSIDPLWPEGVTRASGLDYFRAVSTGPLAPMILAFTMIGDVINVGISFRTTVFQRDAIDAMAAAMIHSIRAL
jgi:hypothetical protein